MSKLYGTLKADTSCMLAARRGRKFVETVAASSHGAIETTMRLHDDGTVHWCVRLIPWQGEGEKRELASGVMKGEG